MSALHGRPKVDVPSRRAARSARVPKTHPLHGRPKVGSSLSEGRRIAPREQS